MKGEGGGSRETERDGKGEGKGEKRVTERGKGRRGEGKGGSQLNVTHQLISQVTPPWNSCEISY